MRKKKVWRYYCDFCGKANCSGGHMAKHEKHCTMNPNRECRMCGKPVNIAEIISLLPKPIYKKIDDDYEFIDNVKELRKNPEIVSKFTDCPACTLAVLRQANKFGVPFYDYEKAKDDWWADINEARLQAESYY